MPIETPPAPEFAKAEAAATAPPKVLPTASEVAQIIGAAVHNSSSNVILTDADLKALSERDKLREGFIQPVLDALNSAGFASSRSNGITTVLLPKHDAIPFSEALEISREAQEDGMRLVPGGAASDVMQEK